MSKEYCNAKHPEILHWELTCPLCDLVIKHGLEMQAKADELTKLQGTIEDQENRIDELRRNL